MKKQKVALGLGLLVCLALAPAAVAQNVQPTVTEAEAHAIGVDAYVYFYPLVTMDITRKQLTNIEPGKIRGSGPMNMFTNVPEFPTADMRRSSCAPTSTRCIPWLGSI